MSIKKPQKVFLKKQKQLTEKKFAEFVDSFWTEFSITQGAK